jgi:hypothetical protein
MHACRKPLGHLPRLWCACETRACPDRASRFPVPTRRETSGSELQRSRLEVDPCADPSFAMRNSLYRPCRPGNRLERRVRTCLHPPPMSLRRRKYPAHTQETHANPRGLGKSVSVNPNRRRRARGSSGVAVRNHLCCQFGRFGIAFEARTSSTLERSHLRAEGRESLIGEWPPSRRLGACRQA